MPGRRENDFTFEYLILSEKTAQACPVVFDFDKEGGAGVKVMNVDEGEQLDRNGAMVFGGDFLSSDGHWDEAEADERRQVQPHPQRAPGVLRYGSAHPDLQERCHSAIGSRVRLVFGLR